MKRMMGFLGMPPSTCQVLGPNSLENSEALGPYISIHGKYYLKSCISVRGNPGGRFEQGKVNSVTTS